MESTHLDLRWLRTFLVAARTLNFRQSAERLFLSQPTVSKHIGSLEAALGEHLFDRTGRALRLSAAGHAFVSRAQAIVEAVEAECSAFERWQQGYSTQVNVVVSPLVARSALPRLVHKYAGAQPDVELAIDVLPSEMIGAEVAEGRYQLGLSRIPAADARLNGELLYEDPVSLVAPQDGGGLDAPLPAWEGLLGEHTLISHNHPGYWDDLLLALGARGIRPRTMRVSDVDITKRFIEEGLGVSFLPRSAVRRGLIEGRYWEVPTPGLELPSAATYLLTPRDVALSPAADAFARLCREVWLG